MVRAIRDDTQAISVLWFGARPTGLSTDLPFNTVAFQDACDLAAASGRPVYIPPIGTYYSGEVQLSDGVTIYGYNSVVKQDPTLSAYRLFKNADAVNGNVGISIADLVLDGSKPNLRNPAPWTGDTGYAEGQLVFNQVEGSVYLCVQGGISDGAIPVGMGMGFVDGTVIWDFFGPQWVPGADLIFLSRCSKTRLHGLTVRNSRNDGIIIEGSADTGFTKGPVVAPIGAFGATAYAYWIVARATPGGQVLAMSPATRITDGVAVLSGITYNRITWPTVLGATSYDVLKNNTQTLLATVNGTVGVYNDMGGPTTPYVPVGPAVVPTPRGNLSFDTIIERSRFEFINKAGLYLPSAERVGVYDNYFTESFEGLALACTWYANVSGNTSENVTEANGCTIGRDSQFITMGVNNWDGINTIVGPQASAPYYLHGKLYPNQFAITSVVPTVPGATTYSYFIVAKGDGGVVLAVSTLASGTINNGAFAPDNTITWPAVTDALIYDVLKSVGGVPELLATTGATMYNDVGGPTVPYDFTQAFTTFGFSNSVIADNVIAKGAIVLRKAFGVTVDGNTTQESGTAPNVSSNVAVDLQGSSGCNILGNKSLNGTGAGVGFERYVDPDFGEDLHSNDNRAAHNIAKGCQGITVAAGNLRNRAWDNTSDIGDDIEDPSTIFYENPLSTIANGFVAFTVGPELAEVIAVTLQLASLNPSVMRIWLSDTEAGGETGAPPSGGVALAVGTTLVKQITANVQYELESDALGVIGLTLTEAAAKSFWVNVKIPNGPTVSQIVTFT